MNKKKLWILISASLAVLVIAAAVVLLVLFGGKEAQPPVPTAPVVTAPAEPYLELNESKVTLDIHNDITLQCTVSGITDPIVWSSSDSAIATVENGKVVALKTGETEITAAAGSYSAKCIITVVDNGVVPAFADYTGNLEIRRTHTYDVSPRILFAGSQKSLSDASLTYQVADNTIAQIDANGIATALKEGTTEFTVSGSFRGIPMVPISGTIVVKKNITIGLNSLHIQLYACDPDGSYLTRYQLTGAVYVESVLEQGATLTWSSENEKVATVADGLVQAVRAGETMIHAVYTTPDGDQIDAGIQVHVERPVIEMEGLHEFDLSNKSGSSTLNFGELNSYLDGKFTGFYDITEEKQALSGASFRGKFSVPNRSFTEHGYRRYAVESELVSIHFDGLAITRKLYSVSDLRAISTSSDTLDGYYSLERDIDAGGSTIALCSGWTNTSAKGFIGTFEGNGHTISNLHVGSAGFFNCIGAATIRNVGFANVSGSGSVLASEVHQATIENIAISSTNCERVFNYVGQRSRIANVIAVLESGKYFITTYGSAADAESTIQNLLVVAGRAEANNGWSGTRVPGIFFNYYQKDDPAALYDLDMYSTKGELIRAIQSGNELADFKFGIHLDGAKLYYNKALICRYEIDVQAPATVHRGSSCQVRAQDATFRLKNAVTGISVNSQTGWVTVASDVPEFTEFTVVVQHSEFTDIRKEVTITVTVDYQPVQTDVVVRYDLSAGAESYSFTIPEFTETFKRLGWKGTDGFSEGVTAENGTFTMTSEAMKALGTGDGKLCVYTEEENVFYIDAVVADKFLYTYEDLEALYQTKTLNGYYLLASDITANNSKALTLIGTWTNKRNEGFLGTFNGDGHIISNIKVGTAGLFGYIGGTGVVKNLALVNVYGGTNAIANEAHGMTLENVFVSSPDAARVVNYAGGSTTKNVVAVLAKGQQYIVTNGSASDHNSHKNIISVVSNPETNNGWSGTKVVGFFLHYFSFDNPVSKYNLKHYYTAADLLIALEKDNALASWTNSFFTYDNGAVLFNGKMVVTPEVLVTGPSVAYRGQNTKLESANAIFSLKEAVEGIHVEADGTITVDADVPELTQFTVVATHKTYSQFAKEVTLTVAIDYNEIDQTDIPVEFDLSTNASRYRYTIPNFKGTYKAIGWEGEGFVDANGVSIRNGQLTITKIAMAAIGNGSGTLCIYTEEEDVYLLNVTIADMFLDSLAELKSIATSGKLSGYYVLNTDIDCGGEKIVLSCYTSTADNGFVGTFDGRGHTISNVNVGNAGFFGGIGAGTVKNLALVDVIGTGSAVASELHGAALENVYVSSNSCTRITTYAGDSSIKNMIAVLPAGKYVVQTFGAANVNNTISNVYAVIAEPVTNSGWSGTQVVGFFENYYKKDDPKALYNLRHFTTVTELMDALCNGNALSSIGGSYGISNSCLTFGDKLMLVPFSIQCPDEAPRGTTVTAQAPHATFAMKSSVDGISINASTGAITVDSTVEEGTTFTVTAVSSKFPGYTAEKTVTVTVNWTTVDWTDKGSLADLGKGETDVTLVLPEELSGKLIEISYGTAVTEGFSYTDATLTLSGSLIDQMYDALGYGVHTLYLGTDAEYRYRISVTLVTKIIKNQADLVSIDNNDVLDGYYVLANDIICDGTTVINLAYYTTAKNGGFIGIFDGRGYGIVNANVGSVGLFHGIGSGTVKNLALVDAVGTNAALSFEIHGSTIENVFVSSGSCLQALQYVSECSIKNMVVVLPNGENMVEVFQPDNTIANVYTVIADPVVNNGWSGTRVTGIFENYYKNDDPKALYNLKHFTTVAELIANNSVSAWNSSFRIAEGKLYYNGKIVAQ